MTNPGGLQLEDVTHQYGGRRAVDGVSLSVAPGEVLCVLGPSGCGKTTLLRLAAGLERLQQGRIAIGGRTVADAGRTLPPEQRDVGMVFQDFALFPHINVLENVAFGLRRVPRKEREGKALAALERVALASRARSYPHALSGGEQQRIALARALAPSPAVMLLDEPFGGLDTRLRQRVREESVRLLRESGAAALLVTHDPEEAAALGDRIAVMSDGRVQQVGTPEELYERPTSAFVARFLGDANPLEARVGGGVAQTPLGPVAAPGAAPGDQVVVLIRPEAVRLLPPPAAEAPGGVVAEVEHVRRNGPLTTIDVRLVSGDLGVPGAPAPLRAVILGKADWCSGDRAAVVLDPRGVHVFRRGEDADLV